MEQVDLLGYAQKRNNAYAQHASQSAANTFGRQMTQTQGSRNLADFRQGFQRQMPKFTASFGRRGLAGGGIQSGVMRQAMQDYVGDYTQQLGRIQEDNFNQLQQFDMNQARFDSERDRYMVDLEQAKAAQIAQTAAAISALKPYMGGY